MDKLIGKTIGQYQVVELAGKGGMATVYKAYQPSLTRYVALKVLPEYLAQDEQFVKRFRQEALSAANLRHSNIMVVYDVGHEGNLHYIATEFLEGSTLSQVVAKQRGPLPMARIVKIFNQLASALDFAHQRGLVHRDIKPSNIFIGPDDHVTLMDFGIAKALTGSAQMTRTGTMVGTPEYMSPEQAEGRALDHRSDIYSMGVVLYQLLTGRVPFMAEAPTAILLAHTVQPPIPPTRLNAAISPLVEEVVLKALAKRPEERFTTAGEMAKALELAAAGVAASADYIAPTVITGQPSPTPPPVYAPPPVAPHPKTPPPAMQPLAPPPKVQKRQGINPLLILGLVGTLCVLLVWAAAGLWFFVLRPSVPKLLEQAGQATAAGQYDKAISLYNQVLEREPENIEALRGVGLAHYKLAQYDKAIEPLQKVAGQNQDDFVAQSLLGLSFYQLGQPDRALDPLNKAATLGAGRSDNEIMDVYYVLGHAYFKKQEYSQALKFYAKAQKLDPQGKATWASEAQANLKTAYPQLAQSVLKEARLDLDFSDVTSQANSTYATAKTGQKVEIKGGARWVEGAWAGSQALSLEKATTNLITNPSVEATAWGNFNKIPTNDRTTAAAYFGLYGMRAVCNPSGTIGGTGLYGVSLSGDTGHVASVYIKVLSGSARLTVWRNDWAESVSSQPVTPADGWKRVSVTIPSAFNSYGSVNIAAYGGTNGAEFYADAMQVEPLDQATAYCDGDQGVGHTWNGAPHASSSQRADAYIQYTAEIINLSAGTVALWIKPGRFYNWPYIFGGHPQKFDSYQDANGLIWFRVYDDSGQNGASVKYALGAQEAYNWHHLVYVWSQTAIDGNNLWLYVDGELRDQQSNTYWPTSLPPKYTQIRPGIGRAITAMTTFERALSAEEVMALYKASAPR